MRNSSGKQSSSWEKSSRWYGKIVGNEGHYYHKHTVLPTVLSLLNLTTDSKLLDVGCGQGVLARSIDKTCEYWGADIAPSLIKQAKQADRNADHRYMVADATKKLPVPDNYFSHAAIILALQNMRQVKPVLASIGKALKSGGVLTIVLNHPCFRIPRQSGWEVDEKNKQMKRWVNRYMTPMEIPISMHPGKSRSEVTWTFHQPLSYYIDTLHQTGFVTETISELTSDKESEGKFKAMENRSRNDIPLFLVIKAVKPLGL